MVLYQVTSSLMVRLLSGSASSHAFVAMICEVSRMPTRIMLVDS